MTNWQTPAAGSVTQHIPALKHGDANAQEWFVARLLPQVLETARLRLGKHQRVVDEEDVALEVLRILLCQASQFRQLENREDLNQVIAMLVRRRAIDAYRRFQVRHKSNPSPNSASAPSWLIEERGGWCLSQSATHEMAVDLLEDLQSLLKRVPGDEVQVRQILQLRLEGYSPREISEKVQRGERAIYRILHRIEAVLREHSENGGA